MLKRKDVIIASIKTIFRKALFNYGIKIPTIINHDHKLDAQNINMFLDNAI